jgi:hypothetical protein
MACCVEDPSGGTVTFEWDFEYDGTTFTPDATGAGPVLHTYQDGPKQTYLGLRLTSSSGAEAIIAETVTVTNVAPVANVGGPYGGLVLSPIVFSGSATEPSPIDLAAGLTYEWDFDYGGTFVPDLSGTSTAPSHIYPTVNTYVVGLRARDKDGGTSAVSTTTAAIVPIVTLPAVADAWIDQNSPNANQGSATVLDVRSYDTDRNRRALVRSDLSGLPAGPTILSATLSLYASIVPSTSRTYGLRRITTDWSESGVTWNTAPAGHPTFSSATSTPASAGWITWDVLGDVTDMVNGIVPSYGWVIEDLAEDSVAPYLSGLNSRENGSAGLRPRLQITYQTP